jgi:glycosyltransferase involved in cell wall biosynthesis
MVGGEFARATARNGVATFPAFAYVGRLVAEKGLPVLLAAARRLRVEGRDVRIVLVGDGPERKRLERLAQELDLVDRVIFAGWKHGEALQAAVRNAVALVMPSVCEETAGLSAIEHMMQGRVVIAADIGGLGEVVAGAGLKFAPGDAEGLAACMRRVLVNPGLASELSATARRIALERFRLERMIEEHIDIYLNQAGSQHEKRDQ